MTRFELVTSSLPRKRSTPELHWRSWSGRRGSNPRPSAWKADALPTELLPLKKKPDFIRAFCGRRWIRTTEGINQQIYSLPHLATLVFSQNSLKNFEPMEGIEPTTPRLQITCSGQLSYIGNTVFVFLFSKGLQIYNFFRYILQIVDNFLHFFVQSLCLL